MDDPTAKVNVLLQVRLNLDTVYVSRVCCMTWSVGSVSFACLGPGICVHAGMMEAEQAVISTAQVLCQEACAGWTLLSLTGASLVSVG